MSYSLAGRILLALPSIGDARFQRSVIALCNHDDSGAMGIGIGALVASVTAGELFDSVEVTGSHHRRRPVRYGGPVEIQRGFILHEPGWADDPMLDVGGKWALSGSMEALQAISEDRGPDDWMLALGYAGWAPGQLEAELAANAWHIAEFDSDRFYSEDVLEKWGAEFSAQGIDPQRMASVGGTA